MTALGSSAAVAIRKASYLPRSRHNRDSMIVFEPRGVILTPLPPHTDPVRATPAPPSVGLGNASSLRILLRNFCGHHGGTPCNYPSIHNNDRVRTSPLYPVTMIQHSACASKIREMLGRFRLAPLVDIVGEFMRTVLDVIVIGVTVEPSNGLFRV